MTEEDQEDKVSDVLALSESMIAKERQEGVINVLADPENALRFTWLSRREYKDYAKALYLTRVFDALEVADDTTEFRLPDFTPDLIMPDLHLRVSKESKLINVFKSVSHIAERGESGGRVGFFGRKK